MTISTALEFKCVIFAIGCVFSGRPLLALATCAIGAALCIVEIGKRDGWL
jgi:hypothetical protein